MTNYIIINLRALRNLIALSFDAKQNGFEVANKSSSRPPSSAGHGIGALGATNYESAKKYTPGARFSFLQCIERMLFVV